jgi:PAS domain S-box-containing protein
MRRARAALSRRLEGGASLGRLGMAAFALLLAVAVYALAVASEGLGDAPLFLLVVPLALCSLACGVRGGLGLGLFGSLLATAWWLQEGQPGGAAWYVSRVCTYLLLGALLGWAMDSRRRLLRELAHHTEHTLDLIATASFDGYFTRVNPAFTRTLGYTQEELVARPFLDFVHPDDREATLAAVAEQTQAGHEVLAFQNRYRAKDGSYRWLEWTSRPDARERALVAVARDVTERKLLEERERRYQERLEEAVRERTEELRQRTDELEAASRETMQRLALAAEYRDHETQEHTERVGCAAARIAAALGLDERAIALIREAAPLHDVGKVGVPDAVLLKPGRLTAEEFEHVRRHAATGAAILSGSRSEVLQTAEAIAGAHHEWWDGGGYPRGLRGEEIPLCARIVALADVFDALTHARPYKEPWAVAEAVAEIRRLRGRQFDPRVVDAFELLDPYALAGVRAAPAAAGEEIRAA